MNPKVVKGIYGDSDSPRIENSLLKEVKFYQGEDLEVNITFDKVSFPLNPPQKWIENKYNASLLYLKLIGVSDLSLKFQSYPICSSVKITKNSLNDNASLIFLATNQHGFELRFFFKMVIY